MGIEVNYRRLSEAELQKLLTDPVQANAYFGLDDDDDDEGFTEYMHKLETSEHYLTQVATLPL